MFKLRLTALVGIASIVMLVLAGCATGPQIEKYRG